MKMTANIKFHCHDGEVNVQITQRTIQGILSVLGMYSMFILYFILLRAALSHACQCRTGHESCSWLSDLILWPFSLQIEVIFV